MNKRLVDDEINSIQSIDESKDEGRVTFVAFSFVAVIWIINAGLVGFLGKTKISGEFGDSFGTITALFSGLAFAGIVITLYLQRGDLTLQRKMLKAQHEELRITNEQLSAQREQMELQNKFIEKQNFETTFFRMLENFYSLIDGMDHDIIKSRRVNGANERTTKTVTGRDAIRHYAEHLYYSSVLKNEKSILNSTGWKDRYYKQYEKFESDVSIYFRSIYNLILYIHKNESISKKEKYNYVKIIRAALSPHECLLIFLNGQTIYAQDNMLPLIEIYTLIKHLPTRFKEEASFISEMYSDSAFVRDSEL